MRYSVCLLISFCDVQIAYKLFKSFKFSGNIFFFRLFVAEALLFRHVFFYCIVLYSLTGHCAQPI